MALSQLKQPQLKSTDAIDTSSTEDIDAGSDTETLPAVHPDQISAEDDAGAGTETIPHIPLDETPAENDAEPDGEMFPAVQPDDVPAENDSQQDTSFLDKLNLFVPQTAQAQNESVAALWFAKRTDQNSASMDNLYWEKFSEISRQDFSNALNGGYFSFAAPFIAEWSDIGDVYLKIEGLMSDQEDFAFYIDSLWLEVEYAASAKSETIEEKRARWQQALEYLSMEKDFKMTEPGMLKFRYHKNKTTLAEQLGQFLGLTDFWSNISMKVEITDSQGNKVELPITLFLEEDGSFTLRLPELPREFRPGKYKLKFIIQDNSGDQPEFLEITQDFSWGVLAVNMNKTVYRQFENVFLQMAVLDDIGDTLCNADLEMRITPPNGNIITLSTADETIFRNPACGPNNVISTPDYSAHYDAAFLGEYSLVLTAHTENGEHEIKDTFSVVADLPFDIERIGPTRIYPWADYVMTINIKANYDFAGDIVESVPDGFKVVEQDLMLKTGTSSDFVEYDFLQASTSGSAIFEVKKSEDEKNPLWHNINLLAGDELQIRYRFDAPNISPEFYLLGPLELNFDSPQLIAENYSEARQWQIASDVDAGVFSAQAIGVTAGTADTVNWTNVVTLPASNFVGGNKYFIYISSGFAGSTNAVTTDFEIVYGSSAQFSGLIEANSGTAYDASPISWFDVYDQPATPVDVILRYRTNAGTSYALNAQVMAINLSDLQTSDWEYNLNTTSATHSTTLTSKAGFTLADADGQKDWLIMAMEEVDVSNISISFEGQIYNGTTAYMDQLKEGEDTLEVLAYALFAPFKDTATNTVFSLRVRDNATGANSHLKSRIFALNLDAFESHKTYYQDINTALAASPTFTAVGTLNTDGNYAPQTTGDQIIFSSVVNNYTGADDGTNNRLRVNSVTTPTSWSWAQSPILNQTNFDATDQIAQNIVTKISMPSTGQTISLDASRLVGTTVTADEVSLAVFSVKKKNRYKPTGIFNSAVPRRDGTGIVDISVIVNDLDYDSSRAKLEYATGTSCLFSPSGDPTLDTNDANTTADFGDPDIDNLADYQIGTTTNWILTTSGANNVDFDWLSQPNIPTADGTYCLRLTANDSDYDQILPATTTIILDNTPPTAPSALSLFTRTGTSITLKFGATTTETNFREYKIFYKIYDSTDPTEVSNVWASSSDADLGYKYFNNTATTTIASLSAGVKYSFAIWAYDSYGLKASSSRVDIIANDAPTGSFNTVGTGQKNNGTGIVDISIEADDANSNDSRAKIEYVAGAACDFSIPLKPILDIGSVSADYGLPVIDNDYFYQIGTTTGWINTSGSNTVNFAWPTKAVLPSANGTYCFRLTVNDNVEDQLSSATTTMVLDNVNPTVTGALTQGAVTTDSITLWYASTTPATDTNEPTADAYKIFYKQGLAGVTENDIEKDTAALDAYDYQGATSTFVSGLIQNTWYVFNIWAYDKFGNKATSTEVAIKTLATISNDSLTFTNAETNGADTNIAVAEDANIWSFRAVVTETNGWYAIASTTLRLADKTDNASPFGDLVFYWDQSADAFYEIGNDNTNSVELSNASAANCSANICILDFQLIFNENFASSSVNYSAEIYSANDSGIIDEDYYTDIYQVRFSYLWQTNYRWRNDDGGE
jgi:hypothetical protein